MTTDATDGPGTARAFWVLAPGEGAVRDVTLPTAAPDEVIVRTLVSGVSAGTERLVFRGEVPPSLHQTMRAPFQAGAFPGPVKYGYAAVGEVVEGPSDFRGRTVFALHPHQDRFVIPARAAVPVPAGVPPRRAVLAANMETALNAVWDAEPRPGERIAVVGAGVVGSLVGYLLARFGHRPRLVDLDPGKAALAEALGLDFAVPEACADEFDLVLHASAAPAGLVWSLQHLAFEGRVVELSWYGSQVVPLPLGEAFHARRLRLVSSQVGHVAPVMRGRLDHRGRLARALELLRDAKLEALLGPDVALADLPGLMAGVAAGTTPVLCAVVHYT